jgi:hypothetical protein
MGAYIVEIEGDPVQSVKAITDRLEVLRRQDNPPATVRITIAPERRAPAPATDTPLHLRFSDLRRVTMLLSDPLAGTPDASYHELLGAFNVDPNDFGNEHFAPYLDGDPAAPILHSQHVVFPVSRLQSDGMTDEERDLPSFTHRRLQRLTNWPDWDAAFDAQLDAHHAAGTLGLPVPRPRSAPGEPRPNILRMIWNNLVKVDGTRKARGCLDGSVRAAPWLRHNIQTYSSCIEQPCQRLFYALAAFLGKIVTVADATNAYQQSPPPSNQCYLMIDDAYHSWYHKRFGVSLDPATHVIPLHRALQGHPEAGVLWERMIVGILEGPELGFTSTTHERNLYRGVVDGDCIRHPRCGRQDHRHHQPPRHDQQQWHRPFHSRWFPFAVQWC